MMASGIVTSLLLIRVATRNLDAQELGLWSFCFSSVGYFLLLDFGVSNSLGRLFADAISKGDQKLTCGWLYLSATVLAAQALVVVSLGLLLRDPLIGWFGIPPHLASDARSLWTWLIVLQALSMPGKALPGVICAQNRTYMVHFFNILSSWTNLGLFWFWIRSGAGVMAYAYASVAAITVMQIGYFVVVFSGPHRLALHFVRIPYEHLRELFGYSGAIFVSGLATQAMAASQGMIVTKLLGLDALAVLVGTSRLPVMASQLVQRPFSAACPRWVLQFCGDEKQRFQKEYGLIVRLTMLSLGISMVFSILANGAFVCWWTRPGFYGGTALTILISGALLPALINFLLSFSFHLTKRMGAYTLAMLGSTVAELALSIVLVKHFGLAGIPLATLITALGFSVWFHLIVGGRMIEISAFRLFGREIPWILLSIGIAVGLLFSFVGNSTFVGFSRLVFCGLLSLFASLPLIWRFVSIGGHIPRKIFQRIS
ncbi:MAG: hypothetical protein D4R65_13180 [Verrucomicrobiaceae bacterium]|nr:MAG: hypothetical protein D4R65_13180 [Verrucomicrobiaceae bacterium]